MIYVASTPPCEKVHGVLFLGHEMMFWKVKAGDSGDSRDSIGSSRSYEGGLSAMGGISGMDTIAHAHIGSLRDLSWLPRRKQGLKLKDPESRYTGGRLFARRRGG